MADPQKQPWILAAHQYPFTVEPNVFCVLRPLVSLSGETYVAENFPNRGKVWWMLRNDFPRHEVLPGALFISRIEETQHYDPDNPQKDRFQAVRFDIRPVRSEVVEVLELRGTSLDEALSKGVVFPRPVPERVLLRIGGNIYGPLHATHRIDNGQPIRLFLEGENELDHVVYRVSREDFEKFRLAEIQDRRIVYDFHYEIGSSDFRSRTPEEKVSQQLILARDFDRLLHWMKETGEPIDVATNEQILQWFSKAQTLTRTERKMLRNFIAHFIDQDLPADTEIFAQRKKRFEAILRNVDTLMACGDLLAEMMLNEEIYKRIFNERVDHLASARVEKEVERRKAEIEKEIVTLEQRRTEMEEALRKLTDELDNERRKQKSRIEREMKKELASWTKKIDLCRKELESLTGDLAQARERLYEELIHRYPLPIPATPPSPRPLSQEPHTLQLPSFLARKRARSEVTEIEFVESFKELVHAAGFYFPDEDLVNLHISLKTGRLNILAGKSGIGKSRLPHLYAAALGCREEYLHISVRPDWLDDRDLIGFYNSLAGRFEPGSSGLIDRIIAANSDLEMERGGIYIVCLDEMNLARVEHYFAQFLSLLERPDPVLTLIPEAVVDPRDPYAPYRRLPIPANLLFVGSVNVDETTHTLSPKVLDRANVITFSPPDLSAGKRIDYVPDSLYPVHYENYRSWKRVAEIDPTDPVLQLLLEINEAIGVAKLQIGYRTRDAFLDYVVNARGLLTEDQAIDRQILQRILPALRGSRRTFRQAQENLLKILPEARFPRSHEKLDAMLHAEIDNDFWQV